MSGVLLSRWYINYIHISRVMASKIKLSPKLIFILFFFYTAVISMSASNLMDCTVLWCLHHSILFVFGLSISDVVWNPKTCNNLLLASYIGMRHQSDCMHASVPWETVKKPGHLMCFYCGAHLYPFFFRRLHSAPGDVQGTPEGSWETFIRTRKPQAIFKGRDIVFECAAGLLTRFALLVMWMSICRHINKSSKYLPVNILYGSGKL